MTDIALQWANDLAGCDLVIAGGDLLMDDGLHTANLISLFTDARAREGDGLEDGADPRGWWGDVFADAGPDGAGMIGSRLWLLAREKQTAQVIERAREYSRDAVAWLLTDQVASTIDIEVEAQPGDILAIGVVETRPFGPSRSRYDYLWNATGDLNNGL